MDFHKVERDRNFLRGCLVFLGLVMAAILAFGFSDSLGSLIVPQPSYPELFVEEFAREWSATISMPVSVRFEKETLADFRNTKVQGKPQWFEEQNLEQGIETLKKSNASRMVRSAELVLLGDRQTILLVFQGKFLNVELPTIVPQDFPARGLKFKQELRSIFAFSVSLQDLDLSRLHWCSAEDPDFTGFSKRLAVIAVLFDDRRVNLGRLKERLRIAVAQNFIMMRERMRFVYLPAVLILILLCALKLQSQYANFIHALVPLAWSLEERSGVQIKLPKYCAFLLTPNLPRLYSETARWLKEERARLDGEARAGRLAARGQLRPITHQPAAEDSLDKRREEKIERLRRRFHSLALAASNPDPGGLILIQEAEQEADQRKKIELLKEGIRTQRLANLRAKDLRETLVSLETLPSEPATVQYLTLAKEVERLFPKLILPADVDPEMVREILLGLCEPGKDVHIFGANYRPLSRVRKLVVSRCRYRGQRFFPGEFRDTLAWLVRQGIVLAYSKMPERTYSLAPKPEQASSELAREIVSQMIEFERKFRSQPKTGT